MITLKEAKATKPLFLNVHNVVTKEKSLNIVQYGSVNELASDMIHDSITFDKNLSSVVVCDLDYVVIASGGKKKNLSSDQDLNHDTMLVPLTSWKMDLSIVDRGRRTRIYCADENKRPKLNDPEIDKYSVIKIPKSLSTHVQFGDTIVACSDEYAKIYPKCAYTVVCDADKVELNENISGLDIEKFDYFIAKNIF